MNREELLDWTARLLGVKRTPDRTDATKRVRGFRLGVDALRDGRMRVHLLSSDPVQTAKFQAWAARAVDGPPFGVARAEFRHGDTGGKRSYFGFEWDHSLDQTYAPERQRIELFIEELASVAGLERSDFIVSHLDDPAVSGSPSHVWELGQPYRTVTPSRRSASEEPFAVDPDTVDRGSKAHADIQNGLATFLRLNGIEPRRPRVGEPNYDLAWASQDRLYVAEVKSITEANEESQLRLGLGQVLRYRHELARKGRTVVALLVPEQGPSDPEWLALCMQLDLRIAWPGAFQRVLADPRNPSHGEERSREDEG